MKIRQMISVSYCISRAYGHQEGFWAVDEGGNTDEKPGIQFPPAGWKDISGGFYNYFCSSSKPGKGGEQAVIEVYRI